jgi:predicted anti-sigma-YlaC factor YlaD
LLKCVDIEKNLIDLLGRSIESSLRAEIETHLDSCADCRALLARYQPLFENPMIGEEIQPSTGLWRNVQEQINRMDNNRSSFLPLFSRWRPVVSFSIKSLGLAAAILAGVLLGNVPTTSTTAAETELVNYYASSLPLSPTSSMSDVLNEVVTSEGESK